MLPTVMQFSGYDPENGPFFDELFRAPGRPRPGLEALVAGIDGLEEGVLRARQRAAEHILLNLGITFTLNGDAANDGAERIFPFDIVPRVIIANEWQRLERGIKQRLEALNLFLADVYGERRIVREGILPEYLLETCADYRPQCRGLQPPRGIWCHVSGTDLVRHKDGEFYVLEDNLRCPSGVSYVLENRELVKRTFPGLFE